MRMILFFFFLLLGWEEGEKKKGGKKGGKGKKSAWGRGGAFFGVALVLPPKAKGSILVFAGK